MTEKAKISGEIVQESDAIAHIDSVWNDESAEHQRQKDELERVHSELEEQCQLAQHAVDQLKLQIEQLEEDERLRLAREHEWKCRRDLSTCPPMVQQYIIMFLDPADLSEILVVCQSWSRSLDKGYIWEAFFGRDSGYFRRMAQKVSKHYPISIFAFDFGRIFFLIFQIFTQ
jgi:hypothetical protein